MIACVPDVVQDLKYFVDAPSKAKSDNQSKDNPAKLELLKGITGYSSPGVLTALMGGSGESPNLYARQWLLAAAPQAGTASPSQVCLFTDVLMSSDGRYPRQ